jgi:hypothetical protein
MPSNSLNRGSSPEEPANEPEERLNDVRTDLSEIWQVEFLFLTEPEYDDAIIGVVERAAGSPVIAYDTQKILSILERSMPIDEAQEYFEYNILGSYMGDKTPVYITQNY